MVRALALVGFGLWLVGCAGKSTDGGGNGSGGFIQAGGAGSGESGSSNGGSSGSPGGAGGVVTSGQPCSPEGAQASNGCADCTCSKGAWACGHKTCQEKICGGIIGSTCSAQEYCAYEPGQSCGAADGTATCQPRPNACDDVYSPVCGCDFKTYSNACEAASNGTGVLEPGMCPTGL